MLFGEKENLACQIAAFAGVLCLYALVKSKNKRQNRRFKVRPINRARRQKGGFQYFKKMKSCDAEQFFKYTRMTVPIFQKLVNKIPKISKQRRSDGISAEERIAVTLQYILVARNKHASFSMEF
ncbi:hypothetical protein NQ315_015960 [Exocentrus adspersus]|uniref:Ribosomal protein S7 n=1 Tax=Exocentrus adspersus TaxID=1586481 RepID=A0AAV8VJ80_9CUCU|nr:hypothetical protein NQ315_015960 [Exocentrus adspersus]